jgi:hypothetical protein
MGFPLIARAAMGLGRAFEGNIRDKAAYSRTSGGWSFG